jgi:glyoxylase-like metal-dependent hydrolase (beta-lactamase superfamily II)
MEDDVSDRSKHRSFAIALFASALCSVSACCAQGSPAHVIAPGVWFLTGDTNGYSNTAVIEMKDYLIVVDANYPGRAKELPGILKTLSPKPVRYVFDTHAHGDHAYGNSVWTAAGATTMAFQGVTDDMDKWEPARWQSALRGRADMKALGETDVQRPQMSITGDRLVLNDGTREVDFLHFGWGHTEGDGYVWLPRERVLATGDAAVNGPKNKVIDAYLGNWPKMLDEAMALKPLHVLPGHGDAGGVEILEGQKRFLVDLVAAVKAQADAGKKPAEMKIILPPEDANWVPSLRPDLWQQDIETAYIEITSHAAAGAAPHVWK